MQVRLQEILQQQLEIQKRQLRRLGSRTSRPADPGQYGGIKDHGQDLSQVGWHRPVTQDWTGPNLYSQQQGAVAAASSDYRRTVSHESKQFPHCIVREQVR